jgi:hypothetical protein
MVKSKFIRFLSKAMRLYSINPKERTQIDETKKSVCSREFINRRPNNIAKLISKKIK